MGAKLARRVAIGLASVLGGGMVPRLYLHINAANDHC
jgi:hypothetical protein